MRIVRYALLWSSDSHGWLGCNPCQIENTILSVLLFALMPLHGFSKRQKWPIWTTLLYEGKPDREWQTHGQLRFLGKSSRYLCADFRAFERRLLCLFDLFSITVISFMCAEQSTFEIIWDLSQKQICRRDQAFNPWKVDSLCLYPRWENYNVSTALEVSVVRDVMRRYCPLYPLVPWRPILHSTRNASPTVTIHKWRFTFQLRWKSGIYLASKIYHSKTNRACTAKCQ